MDHHFLFDPKEFVKLLSTVGTMIDTEGNVVNLDPDQAILHAVEYSPTQSTVRIRINQ